jgi:hypothetical protein
VLVSKIPHLIILSNEIGSPGSSQLGSGRQTWGAVPEGGYGGVDQSQAKMTVDYVHVWKLNGTQGPVPPATKPRKPVTRVSTRQTVATNLPTDYTGGTTTGGGTTTTPTPGSGPTAPTTNPDGVTGELWDIFAAYDKVTYVTPV